MLGLGIIKGVGLHPLVRLRVPHVDAPLVLVVLLLLLSLTVLLVLPLEVVQDDLLPLLVDLVVIIPVIVRLELLEVSRRILPRTLRFATEYTFERILTVS